MDLSFATLLQAARLSVERPRDGARQVMSLGLSAGEGWTCVALMAVGSTLLAELASAILPYRPEPMVAEVFASPFGLALLQFTVMGSAAVMMHVLGRWAGGRGRFAEALVLVGWLQAILLLLQVVQLLVMVIVPPLVGPIGLLGLALFGWLMTNFTAELHGFRSLGKVFLCILGALFAYSLLVAMVLVIGFGVGA